MPYDSDSGEQVKSAIKEAEAETEGIEAIEESE